jgi:RHS repeat-associated protein
MTPPICATSKSVLYLGSMEIEELSGGAVVGTRYYDNIAVRTATGLAWVVTDHHNTSTIQFNAGTLQAEQRRFLPYGEPYGAQPIWMGSKGYVGGISDTTGLTHLGAREYDPTLGRFISADPIVNITDTQQMNGYNYGNNNPVTWSDPEGLLPSPGSTDAHETAVYLRWLDLVNQYGTGVRITVSPRTESGADIVCWNCAALDPEIKSDNIWVWEVKPDKRSSTWAVTNADRSLQKGIQWAEDQPEAKGRRVEAGPEFDHPSSAQNVRRPDETVVVESRGRGIELYRVYKGDQDSSGHKNVVHRSGAEMIAARLFARKHRDGADSLRTLLDVLRNVVAAVVVSVVAAVRPATTGGRKPPTQTPKGGTARKPPSAPARFRLPANVGGAVVLGGGGGPLHFL